MRRTRRSFVSGVPLCLALLALTRCSGGNSLSGSVSEVFSLTFNSVTIWRNSEAFQVAYDFAEFGSEDVVVQLNVELAGVNFTPGQTIDLSGDAPDGGPRATVVHVSNGEAAQVLPLIQQGTLTLSSGGQAGENTNGSFSLGFVDDQSVGSGRTVSGSFSGTCNQAAFPPDANYPADAGPDAGCGGPGCPVPGVCSVNNLCCTAGVGAVLTNGTCVTDCDCLSLNCISMTCN